MDLYEFQAKALFAEHGVVTQDGAVVKTAGLTKLVHRGLSRS